MVSDIPYIAAAGVIALVLMLFVVGKERSRLGWEMGKGLVAPIVVIGVVLGSIYMGITGITEAAGMGVVAVFVIGLIRREMTFDIVWDSLMRTLKSTGTIIWVTIGAASLAAAYTLAGGPTYVANTITAAELPTMGIILVMMLIFLVMGMFMDWIGIVLLIMPVFLPIVLKLPVEEIGYSPEHMHVPGTKTLDWDQAIRRWVRAGEQAHRSGIRKFVMLNAHGGNSPLMTIVATELRTRFNMLAVATSWTRFGLPDGVMGAEEKHLDIHAGLIETSVMLAIHPDKVAMDKAADFTSRQADFIRDYTHLRAYGPHAFGWQMSDLSEIGAVGNAAAASAETGEKILDHAVGGLLDLLRDVEKHPGFKPH